MIFDDDGKYGMALVYAFMVFVFLMMHFGEPAQNQGLVWLPAMLVLLPIMVFSFLGKMAGSALGLVLLFVALAGMGLYYRVAERVMGKDIVFWGILAATILLVAR